MTRDLSLGSYILLFSGLFLWLIYGLLLGALPIILGNAIACAMAAYIIYMKFKARLKDKGVKAKDKGLIRALCRSPSPFDLATFVLI